jgi:hypothetical protein
VPSAFWRDARLDLRLAWSDNGNLVWMHLQIHFSRPLLRVQSSNTLELDTSHVLHPTGP